MPTLNCFHLEENHKIKESETWEGFAQLAPPPGSVKSMISGEFQAPMGNKKNVSRPPLDKFCLGT